MEGRVFHRQSRRPVQRPEGQRRRRGRRAGASSPDENRGLTRGDAVLREAVRRRSRVRRRRRRGWKRRKGGGRVRRRHVPVPGRVFRRGRAPSRHPVRRGTAPSSGIDVRPAGGHRHAPGRGGDDEAGRPEPKVCPLGTGGTATDWDDM